MFTENLMRSDIYIAPLCQNSYPSVYMCGDSVSRTAYFVSPALHQWSPQLLTNNVTSVIKVRSVSTRLYAGTWCPLVNVITALCHNSYFSSSSVASRAFSTLCVYSKFRHHPHPLGCYLCAKFCFFRGLHC